MPRVDIVRSVPVPESFRVARVHCAVDVGGRPVARMAQVIEWAACVERHAAVLVHTWHSLSSAGELRRWLEREYPALFAPDRPVPVVARIVGRDAPPEDAPPLAAVLADLRVRLELDSVRGMDA